MVEPVIYVIEHVFSGRKYVGSTANWKRRLVEHKSELRGGRHCNPRLQRCWSKYGEQEFSFAVVEIVPDTTPLFEREQHWIDALGAVCELFNICSPTHSRLGIPHTPEHRANISRAKLGHKQSESTKARIREKRALQVITPESAAKTRAANLGKKRTDAFRARISRVMLGVAKSPEHRAKLAAANLGKKTPPGTKAKQSAAAKAYWATKKSLLEAGNAPDRG